MVVEFRHGLMAHTGHHLVAMLSLMLCSFLVWAFLFDALRFTDRALGGSGVAYTLPLLLDVVRYVSCYAVSMPS